MFFSLNFIAVIVVITIILRFLLLFGYVAAAAVNYKISYSIFCRQLDE